MNDNKVLELFGNPSQKTKGINWQKVIQNQWCPFANTKCFKVRKSQPEISIGTCTVRYGKAGKDVIICPNRLLERKQVFTDCVHLLTLHELGNEFHIVPEVSIPGGSIDYFLVSAKGGKVRDFVAIEFQTLDTTGTVWPERQRVLKSLYMRAEFDFAHLENAHIGDAMHFHSYKLNESGAAWRLELESRVSTDAEGIAKCLGLQAETKIELEVIVAELEKKMSANTILTLGPSPIAPIEQMPTD